MGSPSGSDATAVKFTVCGATPDGLSAVAVTVGGLPVEPTFTVRVCAEFSCFSCSEFRKKRMITSLNGLKVEVLWIIPLFA